MADKNENKKGSGTLQVQIIKLMTDSAAPIELWTVMDVVEATDFTKTQVDNAMANAWKSNKIFRHKMNTKSEGVGSARYALKIKEADRMTHIAISRDPSASGPRTYKSRKNQKASAKEIRMAFMEAQRAFARLEDLVMPVIESAEEKDRALEKLRSII